MDPAHRKSALLFLSHLKDSGVSRLRACEFLAKRGVSMITDQLALTREAGYATYS